LGCVIKTGKLVENGWGSKDISKDFGGFRLTLAMAKKGDSGQKRGSLTSLRESFATLTRKGGVCVFANQILKTEKSIASESLSPSGEKSQSAYFLLLVFRRHHSHFALTASRKRHLGERQK